MTWTIPCSSCLTYTTFYLLFVLRVFLRPKNALLGMLNGTAGDQGLGNGSVAPPGTAGALQLIIDSPMLSLALSLVPTLGAWWVAITRVTDHKHRPDDVTVG